MIKNLTYEMRDLEIHVQKLLVRVTQLEGTISNQNSEIDSLKSAIPSVGTISMNPSDSLPSNHLPCDGRALSRTEYSELFAKIGTVYGSGSGSTEFNLPNFQGVVPRGAGSQVINGRTKDAGTLGTVLEDQTQRITGSFGVGDDNDTNYRAIIRGATGAFTITTGTNNPISSGGTSSQTIAGTAQFNSATSPNARVSATTDGETRVNSLSVNFIIKVK